MQEKNSSVIKRVLNFAEDKGFYIILGLCVLAIGVSGYVLFFTGDGTAVPDPITLEDTPSQITTVVEATRVTVPQPVTQPPTEVEATRPPEEVAVVNPTEVPATAVANPVQVPELEFVMPVKGEVIRPFSGNELVYDETMGDWRVHPGADFGCQQGDEVVAMTAGTVTGVFTDAMLGYCVSLTHEGGLVSTYCGLTVNETVKVGQEVKAGTVIGKAGNTVLAESAQPSHIHVEVTRDGAHIDPLSIFE